MSNQEFIEDLLMSGIEPSDINQIYEMGQDSVLWPKQQSTHGGSAPANTSDGGPSSYYDFDPGWKTWNDFMEAKALSQWGAYSLHMKDIGKALCRFGVKSGTEDEYDMNKIVYSGLRMLEMKRRGSAREYLLRLLDDPQFQ